MIRKPRDYIPHLRAEWQRRYPGRPPKDEFNDEIICAVAFVMRQIDPTGRLPVIEPAAYAEGAEPQPSVKRSSKRERTSK